MGVSGQRAHEVLAPKVMWLLHEGPQHTAELAVRFGCSTPTIHRAYRELRRMGLELKISREGGNRNLCGQASVSLSDADRNYLENLDSLTIGDLSGRFRTAALMAAMQMYAESECEYGAA